VTDQRRGKWGLAAGIATAIVVIDQLTKAAVAGRMDLHQSIPVIDGFFALTYVLNTGAAFGLLSGRLAALRVPFFLTVSAVAVVVLAWFLRGLPAERRWVAAACGGVIGGAIGNMTDRVTLGAVIDFLDVYVGSYHWPAFNVADMGITVGVAVLCLDALRGPTPSRSPM
jgi:signal peptidase II